MEDEVLKKDRTVQREVRKLKEQEMKEKRKRAEESFSRWKSQKDLDLRLQRSNERHRTRSASPQKRGLLNEYKVSCAIYFPPSISRCAWSKFCMIYDSLTCVNVRVPGHGMFNYTVHVDVYLGV